MSEQCAGIARHILWPLLEYGREIILSPRIQGTQCLFVTRHVATRGLHETIGGIAALALCLPLAARFLHQASERR